MKSLALIGMFIGSLANAGEVPTSASFNAGATAISSEVGYSVGFNSPYADGKTAVSVQFSQLWITANSMYSMVQANMLNRLLECNKIRTYFKSGGFIATQGDVSTLSHLGLNFALGGDLKIDSSSWLPYFEGGYSFPFAAKADKLNNQPFAQGVVMSLGVKLYL